MAIQKRASRSGRGVCGGVFAFSPNLAEPRGRESVHQNGPAEPAQYSHPKAPPATWRRWSCHRRFGNLLVGMAHAQDLTPGWLRKSWETSKLEGLDQLTTKGS
jgi:hypothetical protein